jgi:hypothetical protein
MALFLYLTTNNGYNCYFHSHPTSPSATPASLELIPPFYHQRQRRFDQHHFREHSHA